MSLVANKAVVRRFIEEGINGGNLAVLEELFHPDFVWHGGSFGETRGLEAFKQALTPFFIAFQGLRVDIEDMIAEDDKVVSRFTIRAKHGGDFLGITASGTEVMWAGNPTYRLADGKIVEEWYFEDHLSLLKQLGAIPALG